MRESRIEKKLHREVTARGGLCLKFISPGWAGAPDRIIHPGDERTIYVETKAPGKGLRPLQAKRFQQLEKAGIKAYRVDSLDAVDSFIREVYHEGV